MKEGGLATGLHWSSAPATQHRQRKKKMSFVKTTEYEILEG